MSSRNANRRHRSYNQGGRDRHNNTFSHGTPAGQFAEPSQQPVPPTALGNVNAQMSRRHHSFHQGDGQHDSFGQGVPTGHGSVPSRQTVPPNARGHVYSQMSRRNRSYHQGERAVPNGNWSHEAPAGQADPPRPTVPPTVPGNVHQQGFSNVPFHPNSVPVHFNMPVPPGLGHNAHPQEMPATGVMWPQQMVVIPPGHYPTSTTVPMYMPPPAFPMPQTQNVVSAEPVLMNQTLPNMYPMDRTFSEVVHDPLNLSYQPDISVQHEFGGPLEFAAPSGNYYQQPFPQDPNSTLMADALITRNVPDPMSIHPGPGRVFLGYVPVYAAVHNEDERLSRPETRDVAHHRFSVSRARNIQPFVSQVQKESQPEERREEPQEANRSRVQNQDSGSGDVKRSHSSGGRRPSHPNKQANVAERGTGDGLPGDRQSSHPKIQSNVSVKTDTTSGAKVNVGRGPKQTVPTGQSPTAEKTVASEKCSASSSAAPELSLKDLQITGKPTGGHVNTPQSSDANPPTTSSNAPSRIQVPKRKGANIPEVKEIVETTDSVKSESGKLREQRGKTDLPGTHVNTPQSSTNAANPSTMPRRKFVNIPEVGVRTLITGGAKSQIGKVREPRSATDPSSTSETVAEGGTSNVSILKDSTRDLNPLTSPSSPHTLAGHEDEFQPVPKSKSIAMSRISKKAEESMREARRQARLDAQRNSQSANVPPSLLPPLDEPPATSSDEPSTSQVDPPSDVSVVQNEEGTSQQSKAKKHKHKAQRDRKKAAAESDNETFKEAALFNMNEKIDSYIKIREVSKNARLLVDIENLHDEIVVQFERLLVSGTEAGTKAYECDVAATVEAKNQLCMCILKNYRTYELDRDLEEKICIFYECLLSRNERTIVRDAQITLMMATNEEKPISSHFVTFWAYIETLGTICSNRCIVMN